MTETLPLEEALDRVRDELLEHPTEAIFAAANKEPILLAKRYNQKKIRSGLILFTERYTSSKDLRKAIDKGKLDIREAAIDILAVVDAEAAVQLATAVATASAEERTFAYQYERVGAFENLARLRARLVLNRLAKNMTSDELLAGMARGLLSVDEAGAALVANPHLQTGDQLLAAFEQTQAVKATLGGGVASDRGFAEWLVSKLSAAHHIAAVPLLKRLANAPNGPLAKSPFIERAFAKLNGTHSGS